MEQLKMLSLIVVLSALPAHGRIAGKVSYSSYNYNGRSSPGINEQIIWVSIGMAITIAILITLALCYIAYEKCHKKREYYINA